MSVIIIWVLFVYFYECYCLLMSVFVEFRHFSPFITVAAWQACLGAARVRADFACRAVTPSRRRFLQLDNLRLLLAIHGGSKP